MTTTTVTTRTARRITLPQVLAVDAALLLVAALVAFVVGASVLGAVLAFVGVDAGIAAELVARRRGRR